LCPEAFSEFVNLCENLAETPGKNKKVGLIASYLARLDEKSLRAAVLFLTGTVIPKGSAGALNVGFSLIMRSLSDVAHLRPEEIQKIYLQHGDMGALAEYAISKREQGPLIQQQLLLSEVHVQLKQLAVTLGPGSAESKRRILTGLLISCTPLEAKYLVKIATGEMRIGVVEGLVEAGLSAAYGREPAQVRRAMLLLGDISEVALLAKSGRLAEAKMMPLVPLSFMLADVMFSAEEIARYYGRPVICESKYDGIRAQLHKSGTQVRLFSRKLDDITDAFPEVARAALGIPGDVILDGELMAYRNGRPLHFQELQKRLRRKEVSDQMIKEVPVVYVPYDVLHLDKPAIELPLVERKKLLSALKLQHPIVDFGHSVVSTAQEISDAFDASKRAGHEGLVLKEPESHYHPGKRGRHWAKLKRELDTIDAVIVAAEYGHGKRAGTLSDYTFAISDGGQLKTIGKAYSGLTDKEIEEITKVLLSMVVEDKGYRLEVRPEVVLEVAFDSIQKSDRHDSGFALRFPRIKYIRKDKEAGDIDTLDKVRKIYEKQSHVKAG
jgi:DNA ligase-1